MRSTEHRNDDRDGAGRTGCRRATAWVGRTDWSMGGMEQQPTGR